MYLDQWVIATEMKYPSQRNCGDISGMMADEEELLYYAKVDEKPTSDGAGHGFYQCYCKEHSDFNSARDQENFCYEYQNG
jgi:hypothetical protein